MPRQDVEAMLGKLRGDAVQCTSFLVTNAPFPFPDALCLLDLCGSLEVRSAQALLASLVMPFTIASILLGVTQLQSCRTFSGIGEKDMEDLS